MTENMTCAIVAKIVAKEGAEDQLGQLLTGAVELANQEPGTTVWFALQTRPNTFWIFDAFASEDSRQAHLDGPIVQALNNSSDLLFEPPEVLQAEVLSHKALTETA